MIRYLGKNALAFVSYLGQLVNLLGSIFESIAASPIRVKQFLVQLAEIGFRSQSMVIVTGAFTGAVLSAQSLYQLSVINFNGSSLDTGSGGLVAVSMFRELGPTVTALMLAGRVGASMAAEIGTMKVSEQLDALRSMNVHPIDYLVTPRVLAMLIAMPILIAESTAFAILSSYLVSTELFDIHGSYWVHQMKTYAGLGDISFSLIKGFFFGLLIVLISCHQGLNAKNGAVGVGKGATQAMVFSSLAILVANFFLTLVLNYAFPAGFVAK